MISLSPSTAITLREHRVKQEQIRQSLNLPSLTDDSLVFSHFDGSPYLPDSITHAWIKLARKNGFHDVRFHDLRHSMASLMLKQNIHPKVVSERLGHANVNTTLNVYSHVTPGLHQAAANRLDEFLNPKQETRLENKLKETVG